MNGALALVLALAALVGLLYLLDKSRMFDDRQEQEAFDRAADQAMALANGSDWQQWEQEMSR